MCGIAALFSLNRKPIYNGRDEILSMSEAMKSRGPDGSGLLEAEDGGLFMAHRRLSIIDLSNEASQPFEKEYDGHRYSIVFNGEIYNYKNLRSGLIKDGVNFRSESDTEVILEMYIKYGAGVVHRLRGMFAFAIWDGKREKAFFARDHFGIKPLYYASDGQVLRVASQVKAILAGGQVEKIPSPAGQVSFYLLGYIADPFTAYKDIHSLESGSYMWVDRDGQIETNQYFKLNELFVAAEKQAAETGDVVENLRKSLWDSVEAHLVADVDVGLFLSSGRDSACLASYADAISDTQVRAITLGFEEYRGSIFDETQDAGLIADAFGLDQSVIFHPRLDEQGTSDLDLLFAAMDQPTVDGINTFLVSRAARSDGLKVCLSGLGADELLKGYPLFRVLPKLKKWTAFFRYMPSVGRLIRKLTQGVFSYLKRPKYAGIAEYGFEESRSYLIMRGIYMPWELGKILPKETVREGLADLDILGKLAESVEGICDSSLKICCLELSWYVRNQLLRSTDWSSMAHSLEVRTPFIDIHLLQNLLPLMLGCKGVDKSDMVRSAPQQLPDWVDEKQKLGFNVPVEFWTQKLNIKDAGGAEGYRRWAKYVYERYYC